MQAPITTVLSLFLIFLLLFLNGVFVAAEFAIVKVRGTRIASLVRKGSRRAVLAQHIITHLDAYLSATQLGITITSILLGWAGEKTMRHAFVEPLLHALSVTNATVIQVASFMLGTGIIVFLHVVLGELAPKSLAIQRPVGTALWIAYPLQWFYVIMWPFITMLNNTANFFVRMIGFQPATEGEVAHSEEELRLLLTESEKSGILTTGKRDLLENVFDLSRRIVRQIMVPRTEVAAFNIRKSLAENLQIAERTAHSRYPLIDGDLDHIIGVVHMKDLFWQLKGIERAGTGSTRSGNPVIAGGNLGTQARTGGEFLRAIAREALFVPDTMRIENLLGDLQQKRVHMAMVVDEYGATMGMVTFENVIEEIVGEVQDEFDQEAPQIRRLSDTEYLLDGVTPLPEVNDALCTNFESADVDTISGFFINELGRIPKTGDSLTIDGVDLVIREMQGPRARRILARTAKPDGGESTDNNEHK